MRRVKFTWLATVSLLAGALAINDGQASVDDATNAAINGVADLLAKGDVAGAKKAAAEVKSDIETVMAGFKLRSKKGIGVGEKGAIQPDGVELKINAIARDGVTTATLKKEGAAIARAGYVTAAIGQIAHAQTPKMDEGKKKKADWIEWSDGLISSAQEFSKIAAAGDAAGLKKSANKIKQACDSCHMVFK